MSNQIMLKIGVLMIIIIMHKKYNPKRDKCYKIIALSQIQKNKENKFYKFKKIMSKSTF